MIYLVDSDWVADYLKGRMPAVDLLDRLFPDGIAISIITYAEIYEGTYYGSSRVQSETAFRLFLRGVDVVGISRPVAQRFAIVRGDLRIRGLLIPQPDLLIAATALHHNLTLLTRNISHFRRIPDLKIYYSRFAHFRGRFQELA